VGLTLAAIRCVSGTRTETGHHGRYPGAGLLCQSTGHHDPAQTMEQQGLIARAATPKTPECARTPHYRCRPRGAARRPRSSRSCRGQDLRGFLQAGAGGLSRFPFRFCLSVRSTRDKPISLGAVEDATSRMSLACGGGEHRTVVAWRGLCAGRSRLAAAIATISASPRRSGTAQRATMNLSDA